MFNLTIKNIFYKKTRSILTILGIVIAMQLYIVMSGIMNFYDKDLQKQVSSMAGKIMVQSKTEGTPSVLPLQNIMIENKADEIERLDGIDISASTKVLFNEVIAAAAPNMPPSVFVVGVEPGKEEAYLGKVKANGADTLANTNDVILGSNVAKWVLSEHNAKLHDSFILNGERFNIVGVLPSVTTTIDSSLIMSLKTAQNLYGKNNLVNAIILTVKDASKVEEIAKNVTNFNNKVVASTSKEMQESVDGMLAGQRSFFAMINGTIVFVAIFMIMIIMVMAIHERKKEIGTLKAIGASYPKILFMVISESTLLSVIGGLIALPISVLFMWVVYGVNSVSLSTVLEQNDPKTWPAILFITIVIGIISGILPALSARKINPLESIRYE